MKQNKKSGFALIAGIGIIALIAIVGFLVIKSNVIDPAKNAAAVVKSNIKVTEVQTYGPNCPDCSALEGRVKDLERRYDCAVKQYQRFADMVVKGKGNKEVFSTRILQCELDYTRGDFTEGWLVDGTSNQVAAEKAMATRDRISEKLDDARKALSACEDRKKAYCDGYAEAQKAKDAADKAKDTFNLNAARKQGLIK